MNAAAAQTAAREKDEAQLIAGLLEAGALGEGIDAGIALSGLAASVAEPLLADDGFVGRLAVAEAKYNAGGKGLVPLARKAARIGLQKIAAQIADASAYDAAELLKPVIRVLEQHDRVMLAQRDQYANLPIIHVSFGPGMQLVSDTSPPAPPSRLAVQEVEEAHVKPAGWSQEGERHPQQVADAQTSEGVLAALGCALVALPLDEQGGTR